MGCLGCPSLARDECQARHLHLHERNGRGCVIITPNTVLDTPQASCRLLHSSLRLERYRSMPKARKELSWRPGYSLTRKPEKKATRHLRQNGTHINRDGSREFRFINEITTDNGPATPPNLGNTTRRGDGLPTAKPASFSTPNQRASTVSSRLVRGRLRNFCQSNCNIQLSVVLYNDLLHQYEPILIRCKLRLVASPRQTY